MIERSIVPSMFDSLISTAKIENWNLATIVLGIQACVLVSEMECAERATPAPKKERRH
jgi:hypothetical protein